MSVYDGTVYTETAAPVRVEALARPRSVRQLLQFCAVGSSGYAVNLGAFGILLAVGAGLRVAACAAFLLAVTNNYTWNRLWTFRRERAGVATQGARFLAVSLVALGANLLVLSAFVRWGLPSLPAQAGAIVLVTPVNFLGNKLWSFRQPS
jgi:putative flippase GtrA